MNQNVQKKRTFISCADAEDKDIDSLRWYITNEEPPLSRRIEGLSFGQVAMSMSLDCALNPRDYMPSKVRKAAREILEKSSNQAQ